MTAYYVTTGGNDSTGDGSSGNPWASIHKACSVVSGVGDIINVAAGSYTDNTQAVLAVGVKIAGAGKATTTINTTTDFYLYAYSSSQTDGSNEISGIKIVGSGSNHLLYSHFRSNQKIHDCAFQDGGLVLEGVTPRNINPADGSETGSAISAGPNKLYTVEPVETDWANDCQIYNNTMTHSKFEVNTVRRALIHDNYSDNSGAALGCWGNTSYFWYATEFYNNEYHINQNSSSCIGIEVWHFAGDCKIHNNIMDGWASLIINVYGDSTPYSLEVYNNDFSSNVPPSGIACALECGYHLPNVRIEGNYFANTGGNQTYSRGIAIWGSGPQNNFHIQRNIFYTNTGAAIVIDSTLATPGGLANPGNISNIYIYNNVFDTGATNAILIDNTNSPATQAVSNIFVRNNYTNVSGNIIGFSPNPPTGTISGNYCEYNRKAAAQSDYVQGSQASFTIDNNISGDGQFVATGNRWTAYYKPTAGGNLIDAGVNVGLPYQGNAPEIGAFEFGIPPTYVTKSQQRQTVWMRG